VVIPDLLAAITGDALAERVGESAARLLRPLLDEVAASAAGADGGVTVGEGGVGGGGGVGHAAEGVSSEAFTALVEEALGRLKRRLQVPTSAVFHARDVLTALEPVLATKAAKAARRKQQQHQQQQRQVGESGVDDVSGGGGGDAGHGNGTTTTSGRSVSAVLDLSQRLHDDARAAEERREQLRAKMDEAAQVNE
jgi:hypothetical protein